ncbi:DOG1 domain-containing protein [Heracleum sosnowskyi]|uniref:DOG1 domain-containing protein n=1 Tax=Heracleum sosnowskyi TaxID=360622 RepID=A0AAD8H4Q7_9APIA|nr:DOG1 domain-containing protein [Heracleum sosnowskyi]
MMNSMVIRGENEARNENASLERCILWLGGFRSSELLKMLGITNLQQSSQQAEDALSQGMEALQQSLTDTLSASLAQSNSLGNVASYMGQMAMATGKLRTLANFICQFARALIAINDYFSRLRALRVELRSVTIFGRFETKDFRDQGCAKQQRLATRHSNIPRKN